MAFLIDDILLLPLKGICQSVKEAAEQELENEEREAMAGLARLYEQLESGRIDQDQFDHQETTLLSRLEQIRKILHPQPRQTGVEKLKRQFLEEFEPEPTRPGSETKPGRER